MYYETFSRNVNEVIELATVLAKKTGCKYIGSEHILLGILYKANSVAAKLLSIKKAPPPTEAEPQGRIFLSPIY